MMNSATTAVIDSWLGDCHSNASDSQAIVGWNGPGPYLIQNDHLEAGHEVIMFGGGGVTGSSVGITGSSSGMIVYLRIGSPIWPMAFLSHEIETSQVPGAAVILSLPPPGQYACLEPVRTWWYAAASLTTSVMGGLRWPKPIGVSKANG